MNRPNARGLLDHPFLKEDGRKLSGNSGFASPKVSHSFNSPRGYVILAFHSLLLLTCKYRKEGQPVFAKHDDRQPTQHQGSPQVQPRPFIPVQSIQADDDNLIEEPTWSWGGDVCFT